MFLSPGGAGNIVPDLLSLNPRGTTSVPGRSRVGVPKVMVSTLAGVLDLMTTKLADELVGGILPAGPDRLKAAGRAATPQVVSVGAIDMVNFGPVATVREGFAGRRFHFHNPSVTLRRPTPEENAAPGTRVAEVLGHTRGPTAVLVPFPGVSKLDVPPAVPRPGRRRGAVRRTGRRLGPVPSGPARIPRRASQRPDLRRRRGADLSSI